MSPVNAAAAHRPAKHPVVHHAHRAPARTQHPGAAAHHSSPARAHGYSTRDSFQAAPTQRAGAVQGSERERFQQMWPSIQRYAQQYGVNPQTVAAVIRQESSFRNLRVHNDGTGHGIAGLDDGGRRREFEQWSGLRIGPGRNANVVSVDKQVEFLSRTLAASTRRYGSENAAVREWHRGRGGMNDRLGYHYQALIERHRRELFH